MRAEAGAPDELVLILDAAEVTGLLHQEVSDGALQAGLPGQAGRIADAALEVTAGPRAQEPRTIRSVTVKIVQTRVIASETLLLAGPRQVFA